MNAAVRNIILSGSIRPETRALVAAMAVRPIPGRIALIDRTIRSLVSSGIWAKLDAYIEAGHDEQASLINWKTPGTFNATNTNSMTFAADAGWTGDGSTSYLDSGYIPATSGTLNDASYGIWSRTADASDSIDVGRAGTPSLSRTKARLRSAGGNFNLVRINDSTDTDFGAVASGAGYFGVDRSASNVKRGFQNGAQVGSDSTAASTARSDDPIAFGADAGISFGTRQIAGYHIGFSLTIAQHAALYAIRLAYRQGVGFA